MKKILITSGGTCEHIDSVRVLTNISTGKLGALIAENFYWDEEDYEIHYIAPKNAEILNSMRNGYFLLKENYFTHEVTDVQSVYDKMKELVPQMDVVIHCMAVSDFGFKPCDTKLKSNDPQAFIDSLRDRIYQTPKILKEIKEWNPNCQLVSFKFEVGLSTEELLKIATKSGADNKCELVIANDKTQMTKYQSHIAYAIDINTNEVTKLLNKEGIASFIYKFVVKNLEKKLK